jgi:hypothetical protein
MKESTSALLAVIQNWTLGQLQFQSNILSQSHITTYSQSASQSWFQAPHPRPATNSSFSSNIFFKHLRVRYFVAPSLTRGRESNILQTELYLIRCYVPGKKFAVLKHGAMKTNRRKLSKFGWGAMLQSGRWRFRVSTTSSNFSNWPNPSSRITALGLVQRLTEMSTRRYFWG